MAEKKVNSDITERLNTAIQRSLDMDRDAKRMDVRAYRPQSKSSPNKGDTNQAPREHTS